ncbi:MAG: hypothetical protein ACI4F9_10235 [Lachnospiraceae bacterium]
MVIGVNAMMRARNKLVEERQQKLIKKLEEAMQEEFIDDECRQKRIDEVLTEFQKEMQEEHIDNSQTVEVFSSSFDYTILLEKYDIEAIDASIIKYYEAVQRWTEELLDKLDYYEKKKEKVILDFNIIGLKLSKKYEENDHLNQEENKLLRERQCHLASCFSLGMNSAKSKILAIKHQADELEYRIDEIDNGEDAIHQFAVLEKEERASFSLIAENTAKIICNALKKIEFFEANYQYVSWAIDTWDKWTESYRVFKTTYKEDFRSICESDDIEVEVWQKWYESWRVLRLEIEKKVQDMIEWELSHHVEMIKEYEVSVSQQILSKLESYRDKIDTFYREERKGIYQNFVFQANGELQEKFDTESKIYKYTAEFQSDLQNIIFNCAKAEDRIFIFEWANSLLDIQIDDIRSLIRDNDLQKISDTILTEFSNLRQKNYEIYLADAKSYGEEQARRDKEFNSLIFKMRKGLLTK